MQIKYSKILNLLEQFEALLHHCDAGIWMISFKFWKHVWICARLQRLSIIKSSFHEMLICCDRLKIYKNILFNKIHVTPCILSFVKRAQYIISLINIKRDVFCADKNVMIFTVMVHCLNACKTVCGL